MPELIALDVALLLPPDLSALASRLSASLPPRDSQGLTLDPDHLPHVTLAQFFASSGDLPRIIDTVDTAVRPEPPLRIRVSGCSRHGSTIRLEIEPDSPIRRLHELVMDRLQGLEQPRGDSAAFADGDAREADSAWVAGYRNMASFGAFQPHVTLGHANDPPRVDPFDFEARTLAVCHLGRFCTCRRVLATWNLGAGQ